jgi:hypothetical protein
MDLSETTLRKLIAGQPSGDMAPYQAGDADEIERYLKRILRDLEDSRNIKLSADFNHYGSGYASYVDVFCWKKDGSAESTVKDCCTTNGISLYLNRLAPCAVWGVNQRTQSAQSGSYGFLRVETMGVHPPGDWSEFIAEVERKLKKWNIEIPSRERLLPSLSFEVTIPTILSDPPYHVFDALFYWED